MVNREHVLKQLTRINFNYKGWGRSEVSELPKIIIPSEEIFECVNGYYEGGFAMLVATNFRVLLVDKKPLNYLTVEDMRFDMISQIDYNTRLIGADINISSGGKNLHFVSYNQARLRKLIGHVQHEMADAKRKQNTQQEGQNQRLEQINKQLQAYLIAQQQYQNQISQNLLNQQQANTNNIPVPPKPSHELADYLYAQSLLEKHRQNTGNHFDDVEQTGNFTIANQPNLENNEDNPTLTSINDLDKNDIYEAGKREVFSRSTKNLTSQARDIIKTQTGNSFQKINDQFSIVINPFQVAISKLPELLRNKRLGISFDASNPLPFSFRG